MDLECTIQNIIPPTTDVKIKYRVMKERLLNKCGPNSAKDAEETRRKLESLHGDGTSPNKTTSTSNPLLTAPQAEFAAYAVNNAIAQQVWANDRTMNHRLTDTALKNNVMLALATSVFPPYSILAQRYCQTDHANKTWVDLRQDTVLIVTNNPTGT